MNEQVLHWADYLVLAVFLVISLGIGIYHSLSGGRQRTTSEFIMANRSLGVIPTTISMVVSLVSAIKILGTTAEMYSFGSQYMLMLIFSFAIGTSVAALIFVPWIFPLKLVSIYEYLELRFQSRAIRIFGSILGVIMGVMYMGATIYSPSIAMQAATGFSIYVSIPLMSAVGVAYTALGGMRAVIWTDVFQFGIMLLGMVVILTKGIFLVGGVHKVVEICDREGRFIWADWNPDPTVRNTVWAFLIGISMAWIKRFGLEQASVQRYSATASITKAKVVLYLNVPAMIVINTIGCLTGLVVFAYFAMIRCDPLKNGDIKNMNQLLPYFVTRMFANTPGFTGLFLAVLYGGALSSVSSSLSGVSANMWEDVIQWKFSYLSESSRALCNRLLVIFFGILATGVAFLASVLPGTTIQIGTSLLAIIGGPMLGLFVLGGSTRFANWKGALIGCTCGVVFVFFLAIGAAQISIKHSTLPSLPVEGCSVVNHEQHRNMSEWNIDRAQSDTLISTSMFNLETFETTTEPGKVTVQHLRGLKRFWGISYNWYYFIGATITIVFGSVFSLIFRDIKAEANIDERLLFAYVRKKSTKKETENHLMLREKNSYDEMNTEMRTKSSLIHSQDTPGNPITNF